jgi:hypothetical protein
MHRMHDMPPNELLNKRAIRYAKPYLHKYSKDFLYATDIEYDEHKKHPQENTMNTTDTPWTEISRNARRGKTNSPTPPSPPTSPKTQSTPPAADTYYSPLQEPDEDTDVIMTEENDDTSPQPHPSNANDNTQATPKSGNTDKTKTSTRKPIQLRNPYKRKTRPVNKTFARQLKNLMEARTPPDRDRDSNNWLSTDSDEHSLVDHTAPDTPTVNPPSQAPRQPRNEPGATTPRLNNELTNSISNTTYQPPDPFILINDGTQRLTIRWQPDDFEEISTNENLWDKNFTTILQRMFGEHTMKTSLVKWGGEQTPTQTTPLANVTPEAIRQYLSPKISTLTSTKTFIFGMRLCAPDNHHNVWVSQPTTRDILRKLKLEITVSNSKSSSGNVVTAGYILMKHPTYTHRYFYLLSLRKALPSNTPFFDLATHKRTPHGKNVPHLVVKCGENHITTLSEILSVYLDGNQSNAALFVASQAVKSMTQEEIGKMFSTHTTFTDSIQRLTLYPKVINIDCTRTEKYDGRNDINRST